MQHLLGFANVKLAIPGRIIFSLTFRITTGVQICCSTFSCSFYYIIIKIFSNAFVESLTIFCYLILAVILHLHNFWFLLQVNFDFLNIRDQLQHTEVYWLASWSHYHQWEELHRQCVRNLNTRYYTHIPFTINFFMETFNDGSFNRNLSIRIC